MILKIIYLNVTKLLKCKKVLMIYKIQDLKINKFKTKFKIKK